METPTPTPIWFALLEGAGEGGGEDVDDAPLAPTAVAELEVDDVAVEPVFEPVFAPAIAPVLDQGVAVAVEGLKAEEPLYGAVVEAAAEGLDVIEGLEVADEGKEATVDMAGTLIVVIAFVPAAREIVPEPPQVHVSPPQQNVCSSHPIMTFPPARLSGQMFKISSARSTKVGL